jgi:spore coat polysaccharide biosynthesis protein SpsF
MKYGVIIAARTGSSRLPGKALLPLKEIPMIVFLIRRLRKARLADTIILATTDLKEDDQLAAVVENEGINVFRGNSDDVVKRYIDAADAFSMEYVVRVTGDCPFTDAETLDYCLEKCNTWQYFDLATTKTLFPVGIDYEIYNAEKIWKIYSSGNLNKEDREHLTLYFYNNEDMFSIKRLHPPEKWVCRDQTFTIDTEDDYRKAQNSVDSFSNIYFSVENLVRKVDCEN